MMQFMKTCRLASLRACLFFCFVALTFAPTRADEPKFESLFNGKDLTGWKPEPGLWRVVVLPRSRISSMMDRRRW